MPRRILLVLTLIVFAGAAEPPAVNERAILVDRLASSFDRDNGGFARGAKTIQPLAIRFLLLEAARGNSTARDMAVATLEAMERGAVHDQIGGGFHRTTLDAEWRVPKFEKKLGDQALMALAYIEASQLTGRDDFRRVAQRTLDYCIRDLREKNGSFDDGQEARSAVAGARGPEIVTGRFYVWDPEELTLLLGKDANLARYYFGFKVEGNVPAEGDPDGKLKRLTLPYVARSEAMTRKEFGLTAADLSAAIDRIVERMQLVRSHRPQPPRDKSVLTAPNALTISALARAASAFDEPKYAAAAVEGMRFLGESLYDRKSGVVRHAAGSKESGDGLDYAASVQAALDTYAATLDARWLKLAFEIQSLQDRRFTELDGFDTDLPSATAIAVENLVRFWGLTGNAAQRQRAIAVAGVYHQAREKDPDRVTSLVAAASLTETPPRLVVLTGVAGSMQGKELLRIARASFAPPRVIVLATGRPNDPLAALVPAVKQMKRGDVTTASICYGESCGTASFDSALLAATLSKPDR